MIHFYIIIIKTPPSATEELAEKEFLKQINPLPILKIEPLADSDEEEKEEEEKSKSANKNLSKARSNSKGGSKEAKKSAKNKATNKSPSTCKLSILIKL